VCYRTPYTEFVHTHVCTCAYTHRYICTVHVHVYIGITAYKYFGMCRMYHTMCAYKGGT
jgi:hypothetical protein